MKLRFRLTIGILFVAAGILLGFEPYVSYRNSRAMADMHQSVATAPAPAVRPTVPLSGKPVRITIPRANIDVSIVDGLYNATQQSWTLTGDKAQYAVMTPPSNNQEGNTFIYGHNNQKVFGRLNQIMPNDQVIVQTDNGRKFIYQYQHAYETKPTDTSLFMYQGPPKLTLQTCSGLWDQNRMLFSFNLVSVV